jgi:transcriptional regulator with XRE-family HTH domain
MDDPEITDLRLAERLKNLRLERGLSLDALADASSVSRATLSRLENAEVSPTAQVLGKLCAAYGLTTSRLLYMVESELVSKLSANEQPVWTDRKNGFTRRGVSPPAAGFAGEVVHCDLKAKTHISYDKLPREGLEHHICMLEGEMTFTIDGKAYALQSGDCLRAKLFGTTRFETPAHSGARYMLFVV